MKARAVATRAPANFMSFGPDGHKKQGDIAYFPPTSRFVKLLFGETGGFAYLPDFAGRLSFEAHDLPTALHPGEQPTTIYARDGVTIRAIAGHHRDAPAIIYRIDHSGKSITFSGDIDPAGLDNLLEIAKDCWWSIARRWIRPPRRRSFYTLHSPPAACGRHGGESAAKTLLLAHLSPATDGDRDEVEKTIRMNFAVRITFGQDKLHVSLLKRVEDEGRLGHPACPPGLKLKQSIRNRWRFGAYFGKGVIWRVVRIASWADL